MESCTVECPVCGKSLDLFFEAWNWEEPINHTETLTKRCTYCGTRVAFIVEVSFVYTARPLDAVPD